MLPWLHPHAAPRFPPVHHALREPNGLLAAGGAMSPDWLLSAYRQGIFPWYSEDDPILWWSPDPRMVVIPGEMRLTRSLLKTLRNTPFTVRCDQDFSGVMQACADTRAQTGTWINTDIVAAYSALHRLGWAHSIETWHGEELVGGLYGVAIGRVFYGESMFHRRSDASKIAFAHLVRLLEQRNFAVIDCQMTTSHLQSLGGREIPRAQFLQGLAQWTTEQLQPESWAHYDMSFDWRAVPRHEAAL
ncbi:leucyl/phenylalanyl-tRNA--protein transferase [Uliginosibacterium sediminicola]|uniref:Leucyl/phenylalanyl-tRNA--protein transferase n=1 Tax=Uliginosibacterium sediminicola TaxID=2024550 RepID=A0ABU9YTA6_9RHOO